MGRTGSVERKTSETDIRIKVILDSTEPSVIESGVSFFDHMLYSMSRHGRFNLNLICKGDVHIDDHHSVEDVGICLGKAFKEALGDKSGIKRFGNSIIPMDEALTMVAIDISGRSFFKYSGTELKGSVKSYSEELTLEFLRSFSDNAGVTLHVVQKYGDNRHHIHESIFKALGVALHNACSIDSSMQGVVPSTKGTIE